MTTDAPPLATIDRVTTICAERLGFGVDDDEPGSALAEPSEGV